MKRMNIVEQDFPWGPEGDEIHYSEEEKKGVTYRIENAKNDFSIKVREMKYEERQDETNTETEE